MMWNSVFLSNRSNKNFEERAREVRKNPIALVSVTCTHASFKMKTLSAYSKVHATTSMPTSKTLTNSEAV
jgi:hypothetical protein